MGIRSQGSAPYYLTARNSGMRAAGYGVKLPPFRDKPGSAVESGGVKVNLFQQGGGCSRARPGVVYFSKAGLAPAVRNASSSRSTAKIPFRAPSPCVMGEGLFSGVREALRSPGQARFARVGLGSPAMG